MKTKRSRLVAFPILMLLFGCGTTEDMFSGCDPENPLPDSFEQDGATDLVRDNYLPSGYYLDVDGLVPAATGASVAYNSAWSLDWPVSMDPFLDDGQSEYYYFSRDQQELPLPLDPGVDNDMTFGLTGLDGPHSWRPMVSATVRLDPEVIVLPVYTWRFISDRDGSAADADERVMRWAFDKAEYSELPDDLKDNYWAQTRPDEIWSQCKIQFRLAGHQDVVVPDCWVHGVEYENELGMCHTSGCRVDQDVTEEELNQCVYPCLVRNFINHNDYYVPDAINVYFFKSLYVFDHVSAGVRCFDQIYLNSASRDQNALGNSNGRTLPHELGHLVMNDNSHEPGTLMNAMVEGTTDLLTEDQCNLARTANQDILDSQL